jgi:hypothetical protein
MTNHGSLKKDAKVVLVLIIRFLKSVLRNKKKRKCNPTLEMFISPITLKNAERAKKVVLLFMNQAGVIFATSYQKEPINLYKAT